MNKFEYHRLFFQSRFRFSLLKTFTKFRSENSSMYVIELVIHMQTLFQRLLSHQNWNASSCMSAARQTPENIICFALQNNPLPQVDSFVSSCNLFYHLLMATMNSIIMKLVCFLFTLGSVCCKGKIMSSL